MHAHFEGEISSAVPKSPELLGHEAVEAIKRAGAEILSLKKKGGLPDVHIHEMEGLTIPTDMAMDIRAEVVGENFRIFEEAIPKALNNMDPKVFEKGVIFREVPQGQIFDWDIDGVPIRTVYYRLGPQIALMNNSYMDKPGIEGEPVMARPQLWFNRDRIDTVLRNYAPELLPGTISQSIAFRRAV